MPLHLIKLAVGCDSVKELKARVAERARAARLGRKPLRHVHITRMTPKREAELLDGVVITGSGAMHELIKQGAATLSF